MEEFHLEKLKLDILKMIRFNKPFNSGKEIVYIKQAIKNGKLAGNGHFTKKVRIFFKEKYGFKNTLVTTSCTDALEMSAILADIKSDDEVIMPSYTFVSTANAFILRGAKIKFVDSRKDHPGMDEDLIEDLITEKTKAIVVVHYAGVASNMTKIMGLANKYNIFVIEDAAQAIDSFYKNRPLGSLGDVGCFSFHETKNIQCGEGGLLAINNSNLLKRSEVIWEKGTNRSAFWRGEVDKYNWVDVGSSFLPSELISAFLYAQLEELERVQSKRKKIWNIYFRELKRLENINLGLPVIPKYATNNAHMFYLILRNSNERTQLIEYLKSFKIHSVFHYICLHDSPYFKSKHDDRKLINAKKYENCLLRLPIWYNMTPKILKI